MKTLEDFNTEELEKEIERRKKEKQQESKPKPLENINIDQLITACEEHIEHIEDIINKEEYDDADHYIYETVMDCIYGEDVWDWINNQTEEN